MYGQVTAGLACASHASLRLQRLWTGKDSGKVVIALPSHMRSLNCFT